MKNSETLPVTVPNECEVTPTRVYKTPRQLVSDGFSKPDMCDL